MKRMIMLAVLAVIASAMAAAEGQQVPRPTDDMVQEEKMFCDCHDMDPQDLEDHEIAGLLLMREEEKLARDIYQALGEIWNSRLFFNIAASESRHMEAVKRLLDRYGLEDPVGDDIPGVFADEELQNLYDTLVLEGAESLAAAYTVGALVEDLDIKDLQELMSETDKEDIIRVYENLMRGSIRHIQTFVGRLHDLGETYTAQFITQEQLESYIRTSTTVVRETESAGQVMQRSMSRGR